MQKLIDLIEKLRSKDGCPWDQKQTPYTIAIYMLEEMYELIDAIWSKDSDNILEELGDVLFHIFFLTSIYKEKGHFNIDNIISENTSKMIRRHPHVFKDVKIKNIDELKQRWHNIKKNEKNDKKEASALDSIPNKLPALMKAYRMSERAARSGFDWDNIQGVIEKVQEEWTEFISEMNKDNKDAEGMKIEFGDLLFTLVNVARLLKFHPEVALNDSIKKFEKRFKFMEKKISDNGKELISYSDDELDVFWNEAKIKA